MRIAGRSRQGLTLMLGVLFATAMAPPEAAAQEPGTDLHQQGGSEIEYGSLAPIINESGLISLSVDSSGSNGGAYQFRGGAAQTLRVQKPAGATVRRAFVAAASAGFSGRKLASGDVKLDGAGVNWQISTTSSISSWNHWAEVTSLVKPKLDAAAPGIVSFAVTEVSPTGIDGEILAVIFDDPGQPTSNTVILLFGAQNIAGDTFNVALGSPIDKSDPNLAIDFSLGISFGFQANAGTLIQRSLVNVNGARLTSSAGGQDDGAAANGALITVGGIGDSNANPPPLLTTGNPRTDDELYSLLPFVADGATAITVFSQNPSNDDNIFFAALDLRAAAAIVGEGIVLGPSPAPDGDVGTSFTATATVQNANGQPVAGRLVAFSVFAGPHAGTAGTALTNIAGQASFTYAGTAGGVDEVQATFIDSQNNLQTSNTVLKRWIVANHAPEAVCQDVTRAVDQACVAHVQPAEIGGMSFDLDNHPISLALAPAGPYALGDTGVTMTVTDVGNLSDTCTAVITAVDETEPTLACPAPATAECTGNGAALVTLASATGDDNCGAPAITGPAGAASYPLGTTVVSFTGVDGSGNGADCATTVTVVDTVAPTLGCTAPITAECTGNHAATVDVPAATAGDVCSAVDLTGPAGPAGYPIGTTQLDFTATDSSGNAAVCVTEVTVADTLAPAISCPAPIVAECAASGAAIVDVPAATASDACGGVIVAGPAGPASYPLGTTTIGFGASDDFANLAFCTSTVTVGDTTAPAFDPTTLEPQTVLGTCDGSPVGFTPPSALDACQGVTVSCTPVAGDSIGANTSTCTATDGSGNQTTATIAIHVVAPLRLAFRSPLEDDNAADDIETDADVANVFEVKRTIPNKVKVHACNGADVTAAVASSVTLRLTVSYREDGDPGPGTSIEPDYHGVGAPGGVLVLTGGQFHYNQATDPATYPPGSVNDGHHFRNVVTLTYDSAPGVVAGREDVRLESR